MAAFIPPQNHRNASEAIYSGQLLRDASKKGPQYSVFGDTIIGSKLDEVTISFQVGVSSYDTINAVTGGGAVTSVVPQAKIASGLAAAGTAQLQSIQSVRYRSGREGYSFFTCEFTTQAGGVLGIADSNQQIGLFDDQNGIYLGFTGINFCIATRKEGVDTIVTQSSFNRDKLDGTGMSGITADFSKNNVFKISYGYLGAAIIVYEILRSDGVWTPFHVVEYPGSTTNTSISNPVLPVTCRVEKTAGATNVIMMTSSWSAGTITGNASPLISNRGFAFTNTKAISANLRTSIFTLKNSTVFGGLTNRIPFQPIFISVSADGTKNVDIQILKNATINGTSYHSIDANNSVVSYDIAATSVSGGTLTFPIKLGKTGSQSIDMSDYIMLSLPGETLSFTAFSSGASAIGIGCRWLDKF
jgi:hypothetical protein